MNRSMFLSVVAVVGHLTSAALAKHPENALRYELTEASSFTEGCFPPCECLISVPVPVKGVLELRLLESNPLFDTYEVANLFWTVSWPATTFDVLGCGTYEVGGEVALMQRLRLDLVIRGELFHFDSGFQPGGGSFRTALDITVSMNNMMCFDRVFEVHAVSPTASDGFDFFCSLADGMVAVTWTIERPDPMALVKIRRDGVMVAELDPAAGEYREEAPAGKHVYAGFAVPAVPDAQAQVGPADGDLFMGSCCVETPAANAFVRGDCNGDGESRGQVTDAVFLLNFNFVGGPGPPCPAACDANGDGGVTGQVSDAVYMLNFNFLGGAPPVLPFPDCGKGSLPSDETLGCPTQPPNCA